SLHSLSVDLTRLAEGEISEKTWKAFQKGNVDVFTKRLIALENKWPLDKAQGKYAADTEFRTYTQRFIRQFEEMYDQAAANDHNALLGATIGSSDLAKLYTAMCKIAGRESVLASESLKAA
ncbi:MAG: hypothetical protein ACPGRX_00560, partial [Bdellovibrionales bacterium]